MVRVTFVNIEIIIWKEKSVITIYIRNHTMLTNIDHIQLFIFLSIFISWFFWMWMFLESLIIELLTGKEKFGWIVFISTTYIIGALMYFFIRRPRRIAEIGQ